MVPKASQRANGRQLATHLLNAHDNERVEVAHIRGTIASDLAGAIEEWHAISKVTRCKKFLYSLSINPDPRQGPLTRRQYRDYIARVERKLKLTDQPRAIVFHKKEGREHCHVVWSRIIASERKAVQISHDRFALQAVTKAFARDHGLTLPAAQRDRGSSHEAPPVIPLTLHEKHQQERTGISRDERSAVITRLWHDAPDGNAFVTSLAQAGYRLARGDSVPYAVVDRCGEIHSLPRQIKGVRTRDLRERLTGYPPETLPSATTLKHEIRTRIETIAPQFNRNAGQHEKLKEAQDRRQAFFRGRLAALREKHRAERRDLVARQKQHLYRFRRARLRRSATGIMALLAILPFIGAWLGRRHRKDDLAYLKACRRSRQTLMTRQRTEFEDLKRQLRAIARVEKRELRSLRTSLRREFLRARMTGAFRAAANDDSGKTNACSPPSPVPALSEEFARHAGTPKRIRRSTPPSRTRPDKSSLSAAFTNTGHPDLMKDFRHAARPPSHRSPDHSPRPDIV